MTRTPQLMLTRLAPVLLGTCAAAAYVFSVEGTNAYAIRNTMPMAGVIVLSFVSLWLGHGQWQGAGWRWPLGVIGFTIPSVGLCLYLHYGYSVNLDGMFSGADNAAEVFRYLPAYTAVSGVLGFAIGWIIGSRV